MSEEFLADIHRITDDLAQWDAEVLSIKSHLASANSLAASRAHPVPPWSPFQDSPEAAALHGYHPARADFEPQSPIPCRTQPPGPPPPFRFATTTYGQAMRPCLVGQVPRDMTEHGYYPSPQTPLYSYNGAWEDDTVRRQVVGGPRRATTCLSALLSPHSSHRGGSLPCGSPSALSLLSDWEPGAPSPPSCSLAIGDEASGLLLPPPQDSEQYGRRGSGVSGASMGNVSTSRSHSSRRDSDLHRTQASRTDHSRAGSQSTLKQRDRGRTASGGDSGDSRSDQQMAHKRRPSELTSIRSRRSEGCNDEGGHRSTQRSVGSRMEAKGANVPIDVMRTEPQVEDVDEGPAELRDLVDAALEASVSDEGPTMTRLARRRNSQRHLSNANSVASSLTMSRATTRQGSTRRSGSGDGMASMAAADQPSSGAPSRRTSTASKLDAVAEGLSGIRRGRAGSYVSIMSKRTIAASTTAPSVAGSIARKGPSTVRRESQTGTVASHKTAPSRKSTRDGTSEEIQRQTKPDQSASGHSRRTSKASVGGQGKEILMEEGQGKWADAWGGGESGGKVADAAASAHLPEQPHSRRPSRAGSTATSKRDGDSHSRQPSVIRTPAEGDEVDGRSQQGRQRAGSQPFNNTPRSSVTASGAWPQSSHQDEPADIPSPSSVSRGQDLSRLLVEKELRRLRYIFGHYLRAENEKDQRDTAWESEMVKSALTKDLLARSDPPASFVGIEDDLQSGSGHRSTGGGKEHWLAQRLYYQFKEMEDLSKENMEAARQRARLVERDHSHTKERCHGLRVQLLGAVRRIDYLLQQEYSDKLRLRQQSRYIRHLEGFLHRLHKGYTIVPYEPSPRFKNDRQQLKGQGTTVAGRQNMARDNLAHGLNAHQPHHLPRSGIESSAQKPKVNRGMKEEKKGTRRPWKVTEADTMTAITAVNVPAQPDEAISPPRPYFSTSPEPRRLSPPCQHRHHERCADHHPISPRRYLTSTVQAAGGTGEDGHFSGRPATAQDRQQDNATSTPRSPKSHTPRPYRTTTTSISDSMSVPADGVVIGRARQEGLLSPTSLTSSPAYSFAAPEPPPEPPIDTRTATSLLLRRPPQPFSSSLESCKLLASTGAGGSGSGDLSTTGWSHSYPRPLGSTTLTTTELNSTPRAVLTRALSGLSPKMQNLLSSSGGSPKAASGTNRSLKRSGSSKSIYSDLLSGLGH